MVFSSARILRHGQSVQLSLQSTPTIPRPRRRRPSLQTDSQWSIGNPFKAHHSQRSKTREHSLEKKQQRRLYLQNRRFWTS